MQTGRHAIYRILDIFSRVMISQDLSVSPHMLNCTEYSGGHPSVHTTLGPIFHFAVPTLTTTVRAPIQLGHGVKGSFGCRVRGYRERFLWVEAAKQTPFPPSPTEQATQTHAHEAVEVGPYVSSITQELRVTNPPHSDPYPNLESL